MSTKPARKLIKGSQAARLIGVSRTAFYANYRAWGLLPIDLNGDAHAVLCDSCGGEVKHKPCEPFLFWYEDEIKAFLEQREQARFRQVTAANEMRRRAAAASRRAS